MVEANWLSWVTLVVVNLVEFGSTLWLVALVELGHPGGWSIWLCWVTLVVGHSVELGSLGGWSNLLSCVILWVGHAS